MEIIKMSGIKQFVLDVINFLVNMVLMVVIMIAGNILCFNIIKYSKESLRYFNIVLTVFFALCLFLQNIFFPSCFYALLNYRIRSSIIKPKAGVLCHNFCFNTILIGTIVAQICKTNYLIKFIFIGLLIIDFVPCFIKKYSRSLSCYIFKITTFKNQKKLENDGILL